MAVIRERTQVFNQPVGVRRVASGEQELWQTISKTAGDVADIVYSEAADQAEMVGRKKGISVDSSKISSIDPETGMPVAYAPPPSYGSIAAESYQRMIDERFASSVEREIKQKGAEFSASSSSAAQYKDRMSQYVGSMFKNAVDEDGNQTSYGQIIKESGTDYVASTYATLRAREVAAAKKRMEAEATIAQYNLITDLQTRASLGESGEEFEALRSNALASVQNSYRATGNATAYTRALDGLKAIDISSARTNLRTVLQGDTNDLLTNTVIASFSNPNLVATLPDSVKGEVLSLYMNNGSSQFGAIAEELRGGDTNARDLVLAQVASYEADALTAVLQSPTAATIAMQAGQLMATVSGATRSDLSLLQSSLNAAALVQSLPQSASPAQITAVRRELSYGGDFDKVAYLFNDSEGVRAMFGGMSQKDRDAVGTTLAARFSLESTAMEQNVSGITAAVSLDILELSANPDFTTGDLTDIQVGISSLPPSSRRTLTNQYNIAMSNALVDRSSKLVIKDGDFDRLISAQEVEEIRLNVANSSSTDLIGSITQMSESVQSMARDFKEAAKFNSSAVNTALSGMAERISNADAVFKDGLDSFEAEIAVTRGSPTGEELALYEENTGIDRVTFENLDINDPSLRAALDNGVVPPTLAKLFEGLAMGQGNTDGVVNTRVFEQAFALMSHVRDDGITVDLLSGNISDEAYATLRGVTTLSAQGHGTPREIISVINEYGPTLSVDTAAAVANGDMNLFVNNMIVDEEMSQVYAGEIKPMLELAFANGQVKDGATAKAFIKSYYNSISSNDRYIFGGKTIGGANQYSRFNYLTADEAKLANDDFLKVIASTFPQYFETDAYLDVEVDTVLSTLFPFLSGDIMFMPSFRGEDAIFEQSIRSDRQRDISNQNSRLVTDLVYRPISSSFTKNGGRYFVGVEREDGSFNPLSPNGDPLILDTSNYARGVNNDERFAARTRLNAAMNAEGPESIAAGNAMVAYYATLDHMVDDNGNILVEKMSDALLAEGSNRDSLLEIFQGNEHLYKFTTQGDADWQTYFQ